VQHPDSSVTGKALAAKRLNQLKCRSECGFTIHSFIPGLKPSFSANPSHRSLPFPLQLVFVDNLSVMMIMNFIQDSLCQKVIIIG